VKTILEADAETIPALDTGDRRFRALVENISDAIALLNADGTIAYSGISTTQTLGYEPGENVGRSAFDLVHPDERDGARERLGQILASPGARFAMAYRFLHRDGTWRNIAGSAKNLLHEPSIRAIVLTYADVTERTRAEKALSESEERYRSVVAALDEGIIVHDADTTITAMNESAASILGLARDQLLGRSVLESGNHSIHEDGSPFPPGDFPGIVALETGQTQRGVIMGVERREKVTWISINAQPLFRDGAERPYAVVSSFTDITERKRFEARLMHAAHHDALTHLPNRVAFMDRLAHCFNRARRRKTHARFALLFLDLDRFKAVNDTLGHSAGDRLLVTIAKRLEQSLRPADIVARLAGDEFAILVDNVDEPADALSIASRIHDALAAPFVIRRRAFTMTASIGVALGGHDYGSPEELLRDADIAMYHAKREGRGRSAFADREMRARLRTRMHVETDLRRAIEEDDLHASFEPVIALASTQIVAYEVAPHWRHDLHDSIARREFLATAEGIELHATLDRWLLRTACRQLRVWDAAGWDTAPLTMTVPFSGAKMIDTSVVPEVAGILRAEGIRPGQITIAVTEGLLIEHPDAVQTVFDGLHDLGVRVQIERLGAGYAPLLSTRHFRVDAVKLDRSFIAMLDTATDREVMSALVTLMHTLKMNVVIDGVETAEQIAALARLGCDFGQGAGLAAHAISGLGDETRTR
jgi:diguanylate cyclase (GGDEF)-like protein/PAS domain S-box-containing protein